MIDDTCVVSELAKAADTTNVRLSAPDRRLSREVLELSFQTMIDIGRTIGDLRAEQGGWLGGSLTDCVVRTFHFDGGLRVSGPFYTPDRLALHQLLADQWNPKGIDLLGIVHSHPAYMPYPDGDDLAFARCVLRANPRMERFLLPIVISAADNGLFELLPFAVVRCSDGHVRLQQPTLVLGRDTSSEPVWPHAVDPWQPDRPIRLPGRATDWDMEANHAG